MSFGRGRGIFDGLPIPPEKSHLREELSKIDESWAATRFDSLPHVVHILTSRDREGEAQFLKDQSNVVEEVVDHVVHAYHSGFNKAIQNYSQILRLFSESAESISMLKVDLAESREFLGSRNNQLRQMWYRSLTLRHIISLLDQIESVSKVPGHIEKLIAEKQLYAAVQLHLQSTVMLEREGLQVVGALQDVRSELTKLRGVLFYKILDDLHSHLYNKGDYSSSDIGLEEEDDELPTSVASANNSQNQSRRTRTFKVDNHFDGSENAVGVHEGSSSDGLISSVRTDTNVRDMKATSNKIPSWLSASTPDEFIEAMKKSDASVTLKYLQTLVECLCMLGKVAAAGVIICQRLRPTIHEIITSKIKMFVDSRTSSRSQASESTRKGVSNSYFPKDMENYQSLKRKNKKETSAIGVQFAVSPVSPEMIPMGKAQSSARELLNSILDTIIQIFENHVIVGDLLESKSVQQSDSMNTPKTMNGNWNTDAETSPITGGFSVGFSLTVIQSECQQLICEILRATPEAASADASVQTARLASKAPNKDKRDASEGLSFAFRFTEATVSMANQGGRGWRKGSNALQEGYGTAAALSEQGIYLAASMYRPVLQFTDKIASMMPPKYSQLGKDGLLAFLENFLKDHFLPAMFVDYRKCVQKAISNPAAFRPRVHTTVYNPSIEAGRPVLQGLLATDMLAKEMLGWAQAMPKYAGELVEYGQTFLERTHERCRAAYMEAVLEKQSYMLINRNDIEGLMQMDPANECLTCQSIDQLTDNGALDDSQTIEMENEFSHLLLDLRPIKQENLIRDDQKFILLASLSDSLEYVADSIERLGESTLRPQRSMDGNNDTHKKSRHTRIESSIPRNLASLAAEYRKLSVDCLKVLRVEMQLETIFHIQDMTHKKYIEDQDAEEPDDFIISLTAQIMRRDEQMAPFVADVKRNYIFGGMCSIAASTSIKALSEMKSINLLGVQQICRNSIALEQALVGIPSINNEVVRHRLDRVQTYYELLNLPFEALTAFISDHEHLFTRDEYSSLLKVEVPGREIPIDGGQFLES